MFLFVAKYRRISFYYLRARGCSMMTSCTHKSIWAQSNTGPYVKPFKACNTPYPLTKVWWQAAPVNDTECEKWALMDLYHSKISKGTLNKWVTRLKCAFWGACGPNAGKTAAGPGFMNGKRAFVISPPYLVMLLFMQPRIKCGSEEPGAGTILRCLQIKFTVYLFNNYPRACGLLPQI